MPTTRRPKKRKARETTTTTACLHPAARSLVSAGSTGPVRATLIPCYTGVANPNG
jgi:hypothetical protein